MSIKDNKWHYLIVGLFSCLMNNKSEKLNCSYSPCFHCLFLSFYLDNPCRHCLCWIQCQSGCCHTRQISLVSQVTPLSCCMFLCKHDQIWFCSFSVQSLGNAIILAHANNTFQSTLNVLCEECVLGTICTLPCTIKLAAILYGYYHWVCLATSSVCMLL